MPFDQKTLQWFSQTVIGLASAQTESLLSKTLLNQLKTQFRAVLCTVEEASLDFSVHKFHRLVGNFKIPDGYLYFLQESPIAQHICQRNAPETLHGSSLAGDSFFKKTDHYLRLLKPAGIEDMIIAIVPLSNETFVTVNIYRDESFTPDECLLVEHVRKHFAFAWMRIKNTVERVRPLLNPFLFLREDLTPFPLPGPTAELMSAYFPCASGAIRSGQLPGDLASWVRVGAESPHLARSSYFLVESARGTLTLKLAPAVGEGLARLYFYESIRNPSPFVAKRLGLTGRECEILYWVSIGKSDSDVGLILGIARKTISKHLQSIYNKLRVNTRGGAVYSLCRMIDEAA